MKTRLLCLVFLAGSITATAALGQELGVRSYGVRGGINMNPDHFNLVAHVDAGGGLGINFIDVSSGIGQGEGLNVEPVLNLVGGAEWGAPRPGSRAFRRYLVEARVGIGDTPELKLVAGFSF